MTRIGICLLFATVCVDGAKAQDNGMMCPGVPFAHVCTFLQPVDEPGGNRITMLLSETGVVQLVLDANDVRMLSFEAIINQVQGDFDSPAEAFEVVDLQGYYTGGSMEFQGWGDIVVPGFAHDDDLHFRADTTEMPLNEFSGMPGNITVVMGEIVLHPVHCNEGYGCLDVGGMLRFHSPGGLGGPGGNPPVNPGAPGGYQNTFNQNTHEWGRGDVSVFHSVGGDARFNNFFGTPYQTFGVRILYPPEPATLSLLVIGAMCVLRRGSAGRCRA